MSEGHKTREDAIQQALRDALAAGEACTIIACVGPPACLRIEPSNAESEACAMCERTTIHAHGAA